VPTAQPRRPLEELSGTARRAAVWALVVLGIGVFAVALWRLRLVVALLFLAFVIAAAMRPGVEALARRRVPPSVSIAVHYLALVGLIALFIWLVVPRALGQVEQALGVSSLPTSAGDLNQAADNSTGVQHELLVALQKRLQELPSASSLVRPGVEFGLKAFEVVIGIFFVFASAAYWIFERDRAIGFVCSLVPRPKRKLIRDTWTLIDLKLGAFVRGQLILVAVVATVLSLAFWAVGEPYWILIGAFAGLVEIVPVIGPITAGAVAIGVGATASTTVAILAGAVVLTVRLLEDYLVIPRVLGDAVGLTPLVVLVSVTSVGILFGGFAVILAIPIAAAISTLIDVVVRNRDPAEEAVPTVLFPAGDIEAS
jgi:predicted PurR-regulated permease PerM